MVVRSRQRGGQVRRADLRDPAEGLQKLQGPEIQRSTNGDFQEGGLADREQGGRGGTEADQEKERRRQLQ